jgi:D-alanyl-D-alanine carboxypeptidase
VSCLSGYAFSSGHGPMAFSILVNGFVGSIKPHRKFQDELCTWLVKN